MCVHHTMCTVPHTIHTRTHTHPSALYKDPLSFNSDLYTTNGPQDTTVCMNTMAECYCGFTGANPNFAVPDWKIVFRNDNGNIVSNHTVDGVDIVSTLINGLHWVPDLTSGDNNATNSKLLVGPVNMTHNQSSYQCMFTSDQGGSIISSVGTITVVGKTIIYHTGIHMINYFTP